MLLEHFKQSGLLFNANFLEATGQAGLFGYRGELVVVPGEVADAMGHAKPPVEVMRGVAILADDRLRLVLGAVDDIAALPRLAERYGEHFAPDMAALVYVVNLASPAQVEIHGVVFLLIPMVQGMPWNEALDELRLEKGDFKGQSAADKVLTLYNELRTHRSGYPSKTLEEVLADTTDAKREAWGAV